MFGMGGSEIIVILIVALLFLGPEKLPEAAKQISDGIRGLRKQTRELQHTIENDSQIGGAIRDIKSALRGDEPRARPPVRKDPPAVVPGAEAALAAATDPVAELGAAETVRLDAITGLGVDAAAASTMTMPPSAGEVDGSDPDAPPADDGGDLAALIRPAVGTVAKGAANAAPIAAEPPIAAERDDKAS